MGNLLGGLCVMFWCCCEAEGCQNFAVAESFDSVTFQSPEPWGDGAPAYNEPSNLTDGNWIKVFSSTSGVVATGGAAQVTCTTSTSAGFGTCMNFSNRANTTYAEEWSIELLSMTPALNPAANQTLAMTMKFGDFLTYQIEYTNFGGLFSQCYVRLDYTPPGIPATLLGIANVGTWPGNGTYSITNTRSGTIVDSVFEKDSVPLLTTAFSAGLFSSIRDQFMRISVAPHANPTVLTFDDWFSTTAA